MMMQEDIERQEELDSEPSDVENELPASEEAQGSVQESGDEASVEMGTDEPSDDAEKDERRAWFVIHCYSGYENKVRYNLEQRIESMGMKDMIFDVVIPTQEEIEVKEGKRRVVERHVFPGYVLVNMIMTEESWYVVRNTPGVTGFVGMGNVPTPLRPEEVSQILKRMEAEIGRLHGEEEAAGNMRDYERAAEVKTQRLRLDQVFNKKREEWLSSHQIDETVEAEDIMRAQGKKPSKAWIDAVAAAVILQSFLDAQSNN